ncbi:uncharacterized protein LOC132267213 isoform X2 [Cornus florida]|nr:uncharacterized protein LOC132267213 isoform X2 [Cornus florida]
MFNPLQQNYFEPIPRPPPNISNPSSLLNLDMVWFKRQRSEINSILPSSSLQPFFGSDQQTQSLQPPPPPASSSDQIPTQTHTRNPKKRPRASRRAPTTVLTTDTTNFRTMVQEFTGIPAPPFASSLPFSRTTTRLDLGLFGTPSIIRSNPMDNPSQPPYLLRPFAQKVVQPPPPPPFGSFSHTSLVDANNNISSTTTNNMITASNVNYQLLPPQSDHLLNMQNAIHPFHSLLQFPAPKYALPNSTNLGLKTTLGSLGISPNDSHLKMGVLDDHQFGLSHHGHVNGSSQLGGSGVRNLGPAEGTATRNNDNPTNLRSADGNGNYNYLRNASNGRLNFSAPSSDFRGEKGSENVATRGEGMVESWICSSD